MSTRRRLKNPMNFSTVFSNHHFFKGSGGSFGTVFEGKKTPISLDSSLPDGFFPFSCRHVHSSQL